MKLTDEEIICKFMEKRPQDGNGDKVEHACEPRWWVYSYQVLPKEFGIGKKFHWQWHSQTLTLDRIWEVEEKLPPKFRIEYFIALTPGGPPGLGYWRILHATAEVRIAALAKIIAAIKTAK